MTILSERIFLELVTHHVVLHILAIFNAQETCTMKPQFRWDTDFENTNINPKNADRERRCILKPHHKCL